MSSPRMWGCSPHDFLRVELVGVFPTHVGMFLTRSKGLGLPHVCGDVPALYLQKHTTLTSSTRMWGCYCSCSCSLRVALLSDAVMSSPRMLWFPKKQKFFFLLASRKCLLYKCFQRTDTCRFSFKSFVCSVPSEFQFTGQGMGAMVARHISARYVNLTFHLRRNHHVRRICSRS